MRILLIDDEKDCLDSLANALKKFDHEILTETEPYRALEIVKKESLDLVITDVRMPGLDGIEVLKRIKNLKSQLKVIIMTAFGDLNTAIDAINNKAYAFFGKPINFNELIETIENIEKEIKPNNKDISELEYEKLQQENDNLKYAYNKLLKVIENLIITGSDNE